MSFFKDFKEDLSQAVSELMREDISKAERNADPVKGMPGNRRFGNDFMNDGKLQMVDTITDDEPQMVDTITYDDEPEMVDTITYDGEPEMEDTITYDDD